MRDHFSGFNLSRWRLDLVLAFCALLAIGCYLRFAGLSSQGFLYWDEGMYMNEAKFYESVFTQFPHFLRSSQEVPLGERILEIEGWAPSAVKPLHGFFVFLASRVLGMRPFAGQALSALFSLAILGLFFYMVTKYDRVVVAFLVLLIMAVSPYQVMFSRAAFAEMDSVFFFLLACLFYMKSLDHTKRKDLLATGVCYGICLSVNYRWFFMAPVWVLFELLVRDSKANRVRMMHILWMALGIVLVLLVMEVPYWVVKPWLELPKEVQDYQEQFIGNIAKVLGMIDLGFRDLYWRLWREFYGNVLTLLLVPGICYAAMRWRYSSFTRMALIIFIWVMVGLTLIKRGHFARYNSIVHPFGIYLTVLGLVPVWDALFASRFLRNTAFGVLTLLIAWQGTATSLPIARARSGYQEAMRYLKDVGGQRHLSGTNAISEFEMGRNVAELLPVFEKDFLQVLQERGDLKYFVIDFTQYSILHRGRTESAKRIESLAVPIAAFDNPMGRIEKIVLETLHYVDDPKSEYQELMRDPHTDKILIYPSAAVYQWANSEMLLERTRQESGHE